MRNIEFRSDLCDDEQVQSTNRRGYSPRHERKNNVCMGHRSSRVDCGTWCHCRRCDLCCRVCIFFHVCQLTANKPSIVHSRACPHQAHHIRTPFTHHLRGVHSPQHIFCVVSTAHSTPSTTVLSRQPLRHTPGTCPQASLHPLTVHPPLLWYPQSMVHLVPQLFAHDLTLAHVVCARPTHTCSPVCCTHAADCALASHHMVVYHTDIAHEMVPWFSPTAFHFQCDGDNASFQCGGFVIQLSHMRRCCGFHRQCFISAW